MDLSHDSFFLCKWFDDRIFNNFDTEMLEVTIIRIKSCNHIESDMYTYKKPNN